MAESPETCSIEEHYVMAALTDDAQARLVDEIRAVVRSESTGACLELMDAGVSTAARLPADVRIAGRRQDFDLPVWRDRSGGIRIGLPKIAPQHSGDMDQIVFDLGELLKAIGEAA